jgi:hypothetical protein
MQPGENLDYDWETLSNLKLAIWLRPPNPNDAALEQGFGSQRAQLYHRIHSLMRRLIALPPQDSVSSQQSVL